MPRVYQHRINRLGEKITYAYEENGYWDKASKKYISKRKLIGKIDENGVLVPNGKGGRPRKEGIGSVQRNDPDTSSATSDNLNYKELYLQLLHNLSDSEKRIACLEKKVSNYHKLFSVIRENVNAFEE